MRMGQRLHRHAAEVACQESVQEVAKFGQLQRGRESETEADDDARMNDSR